MKKRVNHPAADNGAEGDDRFAGDRQFVVALHRGLEILRCFQPAGTPLDDAELARRSGLPKAAVGKLTHTLNRLGYLDAVGDSGAWRLGIAILGLGYGNVSGLRIAEAVQPFMDEVARAAGEGIMVALGRQEDLSMVHLACTRTAGMVTLQMNVGSRISLARSSMGRAYMAALAEDELDDTFAQLLAKYGSDRWPPLRDSIERSLADVRQHGFCVNLGDWRPDVHSVAVPFRIAESDMPALAFNCGGPAYLLPRERLEQDLGPRLVEMVTRIKALCAGTR